MTIKHAKANITFCAIKFKTNSINSKSQEKTKILLGCVTKSARKINIK